MELNSFVISAIVLLSVAAITVTLFKHLGLGSILGLLVAGIVVGPHSPGPYVTAHVEDVRHFTELGVVLLLFLIGLEMKPKRLWSLRREVFGLGTAQILLSGLAIAAYSVFYAPSWQVSLLIGLTFALSSTALVMQLLHERGDIATRHGTTAFAVLLMQDLAVVPLLAIVPLLSDRGTLSSSVPFGEQLLIVVGMVGLIVVFGRYVVPFALARLLRQGNREAFALVVMLAVFLAAGAMHEAGLSMALGAFLMGMLLSTSRFSFQIQAHIEPFKGLLMSLFFVAVGMSIDLPAIAAQPLLLAQHVVVIVGIKLLVLFLIALAFGLPRGVATRVAFMLAQSGEFGFVLFGAAKALGVIDDTTFAVAVSVISVGMLITPLLVRLGDLLARRAERRTTSQTSFDYATTGVVPQGRVVIAGYGRVGHTIATMLEANQIPFICFDTNPAHVERGERDQRPVFYGDIGDIELLTAAQVERAALVILTIDHGPSALRAVSHIRTAHPHVPVIARARDLEACGNLIRAGATHAYPEAIESSLRLGAEALQMLGVPTDDVDELLQGVRSQGYAPMAE
ncbi:MULTISPECIES: cation:proton antiporter [Marichromatium]|uniref:Kef-type potassium/proton antiporter (CPA2 family) n=1 Tax=Marichromatium gracile TaxID=1048 RepID=A0A4R4AKI7_MARGR|nr:MULTISPECIES: cation:proton antiporter [Marichromatium]MBO8087116.1 cation:proton antiporter [Marichromatium sp.]MBK1707592.1 portal protein [Marichromatium gracile]RNE90901.1 portal protein [Marichromatium sp. AB32]RNE91932.1 portal protein [Marichromatium sp. AB31]TCW39943.1 Kef-type potassium/proton antiporter (CPA2 family) [Marichromatium gracile]